MQEHKFFHLNYELEFFPKFKCTDSSVFVGIDEAGRGPVLGPMVYAAAFALQEKKKKFNQLNFVDSKKLTAKNREDSFFQIRNSDVEIGYIIRPIHPCEISGLMNDLNRTNLNEISHNTVIQIIKRMLECGVNVTKIYVDTVGPTSSYEKLLKNIYPSIEIIVSIKADEIYPIVSAASICAKVTRDRILDNWNFVEKIRLNKSWGSGYPGDVNTRCWMKQNYENVFGFPNVMRFSWKTCIQFMNEHCVPVNWEELEKESSTASRLTVKKKRPFRTLQSFIHSKELGILSKMGLELVTEL